MVKQQYGDTRPEAEVTEQIRPHLHTPHKRSDPHSSLSASSPTDPMDNQRKTGAAEVRPRASGSRGHAGTSVPRTRTYHAMVLSPSQIDERPAVSLTSRSGAGALPPVPRTEHAMVLSPSQIDVRPTWLSQAVTAVGNQTTASDPRADAGTSVRDALQPGATYRALFPSQMALLGRDNLPASLKTYDAGELGAAPSTPKARSKRTLKYDDTFYQAKVIKTGADDLSTVDKPDCSPVAGVSVKEVRHHSPLCVVLIFVHTIHIHPSDLT